MYEIIIAARNRTIKWIYKNALKRIYFRMDPECIHDRMISVGRALGANSITRECTKLLFGYTNKRLEQTLHGITFKNPIGLAAGFDKDAVLTDIIGSVGFGFEEVGSITGKACTGNPKPRLWRLKQSQGLVVYYGLKNAGCKVIANRLKNKKSRIPIGTSIARTNDETTTARLAGIADYAMAFKELATIGDYMTVNISCPNTCGGEPFTDPAALDELFATLDTIPTKKPIFIKLSADIPEKTIDEIIAVAQRHRVHGFICANLTKKRGTDDLLEKNIPNHGGISGKPVRNLSDAMIAYIYKKTQGAYIIIGCGGVFSAEDAYRKITNGASLVQLITGMIFEGPQVISEINRELVRLLNRDGFHSISEAIGSRIR